MPIAPAPIKTTAVDKDRDTERGARAHAGQSGEKTADGKRPAAPTVGQVAAERLWLKTQGRIRSETTTAEWYAAIGQVLAAGRATKAEIAEVARDWPAVGFWPSQLADMVWPCLKVLRREAMLREVERIQLGGLMRAVSAEDEADVRRVRIVVAEDDPEGRWLVLEADGREPVILRSAPACAAWRFRRTDARLFE